MTQTTRVVFAGLAALAIAAAVTVQIVAQGQGKGGGGGKQKEPTSIPGEAWFRCDLGDPCSDGFGDGLIGDGTVYPGTGDLGTRDNSGAHLRNDGEMVISHSMWTVNFGLQRPTECNGDGQPACRWPWPAEEDKPAILTLGFGVRTQTVDEFNEPIDGGLLALPIGGASGLARFRATTEDPDFWLNFTFQDGSDLVKVTRTGTCEWVFTDVLDPDSSSRAILRSGVRKNLVMEGLFYLPFELTFATDDGLDGCEVFAPTAG